MKLGDRAALLVQAIRVAQKHPPPLLAGDAIALLPGVLASVPADATLSHEPRGR